MPNLFIISGCNGAGKTTASYALLPELFACSQFVNSDEFAKSFSPSNPSAAMIKAGKFLLMRVRYLISRSEDFAIETTLATRSLMKIILDAQSQGYFVTILYFWLNSPDLAVQRVAARVASGGHFIPEETIRRRYNVGLHYFFRDYRAVADRWILADNTITPFKVVADGNMTMFNIKDVDKYSQICQQNELYEQSVGYDESKAITFGNRDRKET